MASSLSLLAIQGNQHCACVWATHAWGVNLVNRRQWKQPKSLFFFSFNSIWFSIVCLPRLCSQWYHFECRILIIFSIPTMAFRSKDNSLEIKMNNYSQVESHVVSSVALCRAYNFLLVVFSLELHVMNRKMIHSRQRWSPGLTARWFRVCIDETDIKEKKIAANQHTAFDFAAKRTDKESKKDGKENEEGQKGFSKWKIV